LAHERTLKQLENEGKDIEPTTGKTYRVLLAEWAYHYFRRAYISEDERMRLSAEILCGWKIPTRGMISSSSSTDLYRAGWYRGLGKAPVGDRARDRGAGYDIRRILRSSGCKGTIDGKDTRLHYMTRRLPSDWDNEIHLLEKKYLSGPSPDRQARRFILN